MKKLLVLLCFAATTAFAQTSPEVFPSDYKPSPCAPPTDAICKTWDRGDFELLGAKLRGFTIDQSWVDSHWEEMLGRFILALPDGIDNRRHGAINLGPAPTTQR